MAAISSGSLKIGERIFDRLTRSCTIEADVKKLVNHDLARLAEYLKTISNSGGVPAMMSVIAAAEKVRRWDDHYIDLIAEAPNEPTGNTVAEGLDSVNPRKKK